MGAPSDFFSPGRLREMREVRGLSQIQLAEMLGLTNAAVSAYETGRSRPSAAVLESTSAVLRAPLGFFLRPEREPRSTAPLAQPPRRPGLGRSTDCSG